MDNPHEDKGMPCSPEEGGDASPGASSDDVVDCEQPKADENAPVAESVPAEVETPVEEAAKKRGKRPKREVKKLTKKEIWRQVIIASCFWALAILFLAILDHFFPTPDVSDFPRPPTALEVETELMRLAAQGERWPGFDPLKYPLAIYDTEDTYLFRHPKPPKGFSPIKGRKGVNVFNGKYVKMWGSYEGKLEDKNTALVTVEIFHGDKDYYAEVAMHELFHVYQDECEELWPSSRSWQSVFQYPIYEYRLIKTVRLEELALANALEAKSAEERKGWAMQAVTLAFKSYEQMPKDSVELIRAGQMQEGMAEYVQKSGQPREFLVNELRNGYLPDEYYSRLYSTGRAMAILLDDFNPNWKQAFNKKEVVWLEDMLKDALGKKGYSIVFTQEELEQAEKAARAQITEVIHQRIEQSRLFDETPGNTLIVLTDKEPLNLTSGVASRMLSVLGGKYVSEMGICMENSSCSLDAGKHPVLLDFSRLESRRAEFKSTVVKGLSTGWEITYGDGKLKVKEGSFSAEFTNATYTLKDNKLTVTLHDDKPKK